MRDAGGQAQTLGSIREVSASIRNTTPAYTEKDPTRRRDRMRLEGKTQRCATIYISI